MWRFSIGHCQISLQGSYSWISILEADLVCSNVLSIAPGWVVICKVLTEGTSKSPSVSHFNQITSMTSHAVAIRIQSTTDGISTKGSDPTIHIIVLEIR